MSVYVVLYNEIDDRYVVKKRFKKFKKLKKWILKKYDGYEWTNELKLYYTDKDQFMRTVREHTGLKFEIRDK